MQKEQDALVVGTFSGQKLRRMVVKSGATKEQVVAHVQDMGLRFSLAGLDRMYRGVMPAREEAEEVLAGIAHKLKCSVADFNEVRQQEMFSEE
jgi:hypothetical protein